MLDPASSALRDFVCMTVEDLFRLVGIEVIDSPLSPPAQSFQLPVTSLDAVDFHPSPETKALVIRDVNRAFDEVINVLKLVSNRPKAVRVLISVSRRAYKHHVYLTVEIYND